MNESINKLLSNSSDSLNYERPKMNKHTSDLAGLLITELMNMLTKKMVFMPQKVLFTYFLLRQQMKNMELMSGTMENCGKMIIPKK